MNTGLYYRTKICFIDSYEFDFHSKIPLTY